ncbi:MAG TPA: SpoIID/LytB domain-containing protein [Bacillota bacterium]
MLAQNGKGCGLKQPINERMAKLLLILTVLLLTILPAPGLSLKNKEFTEPTGSGRMCTGTVWAKPAPDSASSFLYEKAVSLYYQGKPAESINILRQYVLDYPEDNQARLDLVVLLREAGRLQEAYTHLDLLSRKYPRDQEYQSERAKTAYLLGQADLLRKLKAYGDPAEGFHYWRNMGYLDFEHQEKLKAVNALRSSPAAEAKSALTYYALGRAYLEQREYAAAEAHLREALRKDAYFNVALYPLAQAYVGQGKIRAAYDCLKKLCLLAPWDQTADAELTRLVANHPELTVDEQRAKAEKVIVTSPIRVTPFHSQGKTVPVIRVGLAENIQDLQIKTGGSFILVEEGGSAKVTGPAETILSVHAQDGKARITTGDGRVLLTTGSTVTLSYEDTVTSNPQASTKTVPTTAVFNLEFGKGQYWAGEADRFYRGEIQFRPGQKGITVINRLSLEEYLYSVLPAEMPASWPQEALRAQAIAARSYVLANMGSFAQRGFDVMGSVLSAAYKGAKNETQKTNWAVDTTRGQVMTYNGKVISAFFSANSGGYTESQKSVWGSDNPYLQAVPDKLLPQKDGRFSPYQLYQWVKTRPRTYSANSTSSYRWQVLVPAADIENRLGLGDKVGRITAITTAGRGISGRIEKVIIKGENGDYELTGDLNIRNKLGGLRSTLFVVEPKYGKSGLPEFFLFTGAGWGHGVGMCQTGASGMAAAGYKGEEILTHYYSGVEITTLY